MTDTITRYVTTEELAEAECSASYAPAIGRGTDAETVRLVGTDVDTGREYLLLPGESGDTAPIHIDRIAKALGL